MGTRGPLRRYTVYVQKGSGYPRLKVADRVDRTLGDPRGWTRGPFRFQRVNAGADTQILLAFPEVVDKLCWPLETEGQVSCCQGSIIAINLDRWLHAVPHWTGNLTSYRQMLINHEMGHRIGKNHERCPGPGLPAPVMQQQTYGLQGCQANSWPLTSELLATQST